MTDFTVPGLTLNSTPLQPANDQSTPQQYMSRLSDADLMEMHSQDIDAVGRIQRSLTALNQLRNGRPPANYDEAQLLQRGLGPEIDEHTSRLNAAQRDVAARLQEMQRRGLAQAPQGFGLPMSAPQLVTHPWASGMLRLDELYRRHHEGGMPAND